MRRFDNDVFLFTTWQRYPYDDVCARGHRGGIRDHRRISVWPGEPLARHGTVLEKKTGSVPAQRCRPCGRFCRLTEPAQSPDGTLVIASDDDVVLLHNDDDVYRTGHVSLQELVRGGKEHPSRLVRDYYEVGIGRGFLEPDDALRVRNRVFPSTPNSQYSEIDKSFPTES